MYRISLGLLLAISLFVGCGRQVIMPPPMRATKPMAATSIVERGDLQIGDGIRHGNLTVFPIYSRTPRNDDRYITLDEGLKAGTVEIVEVGSAESAANPAAAVNPPPAQHGTPEDELRYPAGWDRLANASNELAPADDPTEEDAFAALLEQFAVPQPGRQGQGAAVNQLMVINRSDRPLYLMPGEVIVGGQQDRTIGEEIIITATGKPVPIDVYCVESGRWRGRNDAENASVFEGNLSLVVSNTSEVADLDALVGVVSKQAAEGKFILSPGAANNATRLAAQESADKSTRQPKVWEEVAKANAKAGTENETGAYTHNLADPEAVDRMKPYLDALQERVAGQERIVGAIVAINGKVIAADTFESTPLFRKLWPKLLKGHAVDAITESESEDAGKACPQTDALAFVDEARNAKVESAEEKSGLHVTRRSSGEQSPFVISVIPVDGSSAAMPSSAGGFGGGVHSSAFGKK